MPDRPPYALLLDWMTESLAIAPTSEPVATGVVWIDSGVVSVSVGIPPAFSDHPDDATADHGGTATFSVTASNATSYQWQKQESGAGAWSNVSGATLSSYTTGVLTYAADNTDKYRCVATGPGGSTTSNSATLTLNPPLTVTLIYDDDFTIDRAAPITGNSAFAASGAGNTKLYNNTNAAITGGVIAFNGDTVIMVMDAAAGRSRTAGRIHYCKHAIGTTTDFQSFTPISLVGESPAANWWALTQGEPGIKFKGGTAGFGDIRNITGLSDGNYQWSSAVTQEKTYEWALLERGSAGSMSFMRIDAGSWRMITFEKHTTDAGKIQARNEAGGVTSIDRLCTANTNWAPTPLVQHSFSSVTGPSDGAGQPETGGSGITLHTVGSVTITSGTLQMSADGTGSVDGDTGQTEIAVSADFTVYDGSPCGLILRKVDDLNYLMLKVNSSTNTLALIEVVAGSETTLISEDSNDGTPDSYDLPDASAIRLQAHIDGNVIRAVYSPGSLHSTFVQYTTTRFASATKAGVFVSKGSGVNSAKASNFVAFNQVQSLPTMVNT